MLLLLLLLLLVVVEATKALLVTAVAGATKADVDEQMVLRMMAGIESFMINFYFNKR